MSKKVGFIIPSLKNGGAERVLSTISMNLSEEIEQFIFTWNGKHVDYEFKGRIVEVDIQNSTSLIKNIAVLFKRVRAMREYKKIYNIDTCVSHLEGPNIVNILSKGKEKVVITVHNFQSKERTGLYGFIFKVLIELLYNKADEIVVVSKAIKEDLINNFNISREKIKVIYNPFDCEKIEKLSKEELEDEYKIIFEKDVIINMGRLTEQKGQWHLIKSFHELKKLNDNVNLVILGQGELENKLKKLVEDLSLEDSVFFLNFQSNPFKFISRSKVFSLTSLYEGFPMCIAEAMACGTPVISVDCKSGPKEILCRKYLDQNIENMQYCDFGVLVKSFNSNIDIINTNINATEKIFAETVNNMLNDNLRLGDYSEKGKVRVKDFNVSNIINEWHKIIY